MTDGGDADKHEPEPPGLDQDARDSIGRTDQAVVRRTDPLRCALAFREPERFRIQGSGNGGRGWD